jgi:hypothetical protein
VRWDGEVVVDRCCNGLGIHNHKHMNSKKLNMKDMSLVIVMELKNLEEVNKKFEVVVHKYI